MPTVSREELASEDIVAERGLVRMKRSDDRSPGAFGTPLSMCEGKKPFDGKSHADYAARRYPGRNSYRCRYCRKWHVGNSLDK